MTPVTFMTLCQSDSSFTDLTSRKIKSNLAELVLLVHAGHRCDSNPGTDKLWHMSGSPCCRAGQPVVTKAVTLALLELAEYHHLLA